MLAELGRHAQVLAGRAEPRAHAQSAARRPSALSTSGAWTSSTASLPTGLLRLGATTRQADALRSAVGRRAAPLLTAALRHVGASGYAQPGTVGGSIAHADPAAELPAVLLALDGEAIVVSPAGSARFRRRRLSLGPFETALEEGRAAHGRCDLGDMPERRFGFSEIARRRGDFALAGAAVVVAPGHARARSLAVAPCAFRASEAERRWRRAPGRRRRRQLAAAASDPSDDPHAPAGYRREAARVATLRALLEPRGSRVDDERVVQLRVNGREHLALAEPRTLLSDFLRHELGLTGTHVGCEHGVCGACTVLRRRAPSRSCLMLAVQAEGARGRDGRGARGRGRLHPIQQAFREQPRPAVRLLHARDADRGQARCSTRCPTRREDEIRDAPVRQRLPLHGLRRHRRGGARSPRRCCQEDAAMTEPADARRARVMRRRGSALPRAAAASTSTTSSLPGMLHVAFCRSPYAHARIVSVDAARRARAATASRRRQRRGPARPVRRSSTTIATRPEAKTATRHMPSLDRVRFVGEAVAVVVARSRARRRGRGRADRRRVRAAAGGARRGGRARAGRAGPARRAGRQQLRAHRVRGGRRRRRVRGRRRTSSASASTSAARTRRRSRAAA